MSVPAHSMQASQFVKAIDEKRFGEIEGCTVIGQVGIRGARFDHPFRIQHVTFEGEVDFADVTIDGELDFSGCTFTKTLTLSRAEIRGNLILDDIVLVDANPPANRALRMPSPLDLQGAVVRGDLRLARAEIESESPGTTVSMNGARVTGNVLLNGIQCYLTMDLGGMHINGDLRVETDALGNRPMIDRNILGQNIRIDGDIRFVGAMVRGDVQFLNCDVGGSVWAFCDMIAQSGAKRANVYCCRFDGDFILSFSRISGFVYITGASIGKTINLTASEIGTLACESAVFQVSNDNDDPVYEMELCRFGEISAAHAVVKSWTNLSMIQIAGKGDLGRVKAVNLMGFVSGGDLSFFAFNAFDYQGMAVPQLPWSFSQGANVLGNIDLTGAQIGGDLIMTNLRADGAVSLVRARVSGKLVFRTLDSILADPQATERMGSRVQIPLRGASLHRLDMTSMDCGNDIDLTGLRVIDPDLTEHQTSISTKLPVKGVVAARAIETKGELRLFRRGNAGGDTFTWIDHSIDLSNSAVDRLVLSAYSFDKDTAMPDDVARAGINLANAKIRELEIPAIRATPPNPPRSIFPVPIDLGDSDISIWNIEDDVLPTGKRFSALLQQDKRFRRSTYLAIERYFRNRGYDEDANAIYQSMSMLAHQQHLNDLGKARWKRASSAYFWFWRNPWYVAFKHVLGFGTAPMRLGWIILALWLFSLPLYQNAFNFQPTAAERAARLREEAIKAGTKNEDIKAGPRIGEWNFGDAVAISLRYHIPLAGVVVRSSWELRDNPTTCWGYELFPGQKNRAIRTRAEASKPAKCSGWTLTWLSPEDWGVVMSILNLIMWPLLLTFGVRKLLRQS